MKLIKTLLVLPVLITISSLYGDGWADSPCEGEKAHCAALKAPECASWCDDVDPFCGNAAFNSKGCETRKVTIGGNISTGYQYVDVNDDINTNHNPDEYNNFLMHHIRLNVNAELGNDWSGFMSIDFAGRPTTNFSDYEDDGEITGANGSDFHPFVGRKVNRCCACVDQCKLFVDRAYIQKIWLDSTMRFGYQKVNWGAEQVTPEPHLKTIHRSIATHFFTNLGHRPTSGFPPLHHMAINEDLEYRYVGEPLGGRHVGAFLAGQFGAFHYSSAITSGHQGLCMNSDEFNNGLGFYASVAFEGGVDEIDFLMGINTAYKPKGANERSFVDRNVYGFNPYIYANWCRLSVMAEFFWGSVEDGNGLDEFGDADPWGFNVIPTYMLNDCWELVGRFSYINTDLMGTTIANAFGCAPDNGKNTENNPTEVVCDTLFEKAYAGYIGLNYYLMNGAVKLSFGLEQAKFKNRMSGEYKHVSNIAGVEPTFSHGVNTASSDGSNISNNKGAKVNSARAQIQFLF